MQVEVEALRQKICGGNFHLIAANFLTESKTCPTFSQRKLCFLNLDYGYAGSLFVLTRVLV